MFIDPIMDITHSPLGPIYFQHLFQSEYWWTTKIAEENEFMIVAKDSVVSADLNTNDELNVDFGAGLGNMFDKHSFY